MNIMEACQLCHEQGETLPVGPNGMYICWQCYVDSSPELQKEIAWRFVNLNKERNKKIAS